MRIDQRSCDEHRFDDVLRPENVWVTYDLYAGCSDSRNLGHYRSDILIYVVRQDSLDYKYVCVAVHCLEHAEVIYITVCVEVQVGQHERRIVYKVLEFLYGRGLRESCSDGLQVKCKGYVVVCSDNACGGCDGTCLRNGDTGAVCS